MSSFAGLSFGGVVAACCVVGALTVGATVRLGQSPAEASRAVPAIATEEYGKRLLAQTPELLGPDVADPKLRYTSSRLSCGSCHLGDGTEPGTLSLPDTTSHYPRYSARYGATTTI